MSQLQLGHGRLCCCRLGANSLSVRMSARPNHSFKTNAWRKKNRKIKQPWQSRGKLQLPCLGLFGFVPFCLAFVDSFLISVMFFSLFWKGQLASCFVTLAKCWLCKPWRIFGTRTSHLWSGRMHGPHDSNYPKEVLEIGAAVASVSAPSAPSLQPSSTILACPHVSQECANSVLHHLHLPMMFSVRWKNNQSEQSSYCNIWDVAVSFQRHHNMIVAYTLTYTYTHTHTYTIIYIHIISYNNHKYIVRYPGRLQGSGRYSICCRWWISCTRLLRCSVKAATFSLGKWFALEAALPLAAWHWHHPRSNAQQYATKLQRCAMTPGSATFSAGNCTTPKHHGTLLWHYYGNIYGNMLWQSLQNLFWTWPLLAGNPTWHAAYLGKTANRTIELENTNISDYEINLVRCASALAEVRLPAFLFKVTLQLYILCTKTGIWYGHVANNVSSTRMHDFSEPELKTFMILCLWSCVSIFCIYLVYLSTYLSIYLPTYLPT